ATARSRSPRRSTTARSSPQWRGLALHGLARYSNPAAPAEPVDALVVGYGTPPDHTWSGALDALCAVLPG
ncbi:hypothetical protein ABZ281_48685, partial [Streptomyces sp. NPDC006265]